MSRFQGDPAVQITQDGADMKFIGGQPVMDQGFENAAQISLFTDQGWWGNVLQRDESKKIGSDFPAVQREPITDIRTINDYTDAAERAFKWMRDTGVARKITVTVTNPRVNYVITRVEITPPGGDDEQLLFIKNGINWISQAQNPAHGRL